MENVSHALILIVFYVILMQAHVLNAYLAMGQELLFVNHVQYLRVKIVIQHMIYVMLVIAHLDLMETHVYPVPKQAASNATETQVNA